MSSNQYIFKRMYDNVFNSDVCYTNGMCDRRSVTWPSDSVNGKNNCDNVTVTTRVFYNSKCQKENVKALFSRGNKRRLLTQGREVKTHVPRSHRTSCVPNNSDRSYGVTVSHHLPHVSDDNDTPHKIVHQVVSNKSTDVVTCPQVHQRVSQVELDSKLGGHLTGGHMKEVSLARHRCDINSIHEPSSSRNSVVGGNTVTHENHKCDNTEREGGGQNSVNV